ncbi:hypothetical protein GA0070613_6464 [Micromonospora inositola]|uniref:Transcriptional regulator, AlpA family n=2 Tax=Micromonospora inositola TaxID=47865 RepID=A0A1C5K5Q5_9ACTN|nr:hypothetical protein GA0070613_6464 [Micromonospora inositola]
MATLRPCHGTCMERGEIAARLGVSRQRARQIIDRPDFPGPYDRLGMGAVWLKRDVEAWIAEHRPHLGEPDEE